MSWDSLEGDERVRFCTSCSQHVFNVAAMTREEAMDVIRAYGGQPCLRMFRRADGTVLTADCPQRPRARRRLHVLAGALATAGAAIALGGVVAERAEPVGVREVAPLRVPAPLTKTQFPPDGGWTLGIVAPSEDAFQWPIVEDDATAKDESGS